MTGDEIRDLIAAEARKAGSAGILTQESQSERRGPWLQVRTPHGFEWNRYELGIEGLRPELEGFRIVHLSDLHLKPFWSPVYQNLAERVTAAQADVVLVTGDFVDSKTRGIKAVPYVLKFLEGVKSRLGSYGILGNHDGDLIGPYLSKGGIELLDGQRVEITSGVEVVGTTGTTREDFDWGMMRTMPQKPDGGVRIVMSHYPDTLLRLGIIRPDIVLAGHTHGGQICLPGGNPIISHDSLPKRLCKGAHRIGNTWLVTSRGLGFTSLAIRLWCPAEVVEITLRRLNQ